MADHAEAEPESPRCAVGAIFVVEFSKRRAIIVPELGREVVELERRSTQQRKNEEAYQEGRQKALNDPVDISFLKEMTHVITSVTIPSTEEARCYWAGYQAGLGEKEAIRIGPSHKPTSRGLYVPPPDEDNEPNWQRLATNERAEAPKENITFTTPLDVTGDSKDSSIKNVVILCCGFLLLIGYFFGYLFVVRLNASQHDFVVRFWMMTIGPFFWTILVYPFSDRWPYKFLMLWTAFVLLFALVMFFPNGLALLR